MFLKNNTLLFSYKDYLEKNKNLSDSSMYAYLTSVEAYLSEGLNPYKLEDYNNFLIKRAIKGRSNIHYTALKFFVKSIPDMERSEKIKIIETLIAPQKPSIPVTERKYLDETKLLKVINSMKHHRHRIIAIIQYLTGLRVGDVFRLPRGNIVPEIYNKKLVLKLIVVGKGKKRNIVFIHDEIIQQLIVTFIVNNFIHEDYYFMKDLRRVRNPDRIRHEMNFYKSNYKKYIRDLHQALERNGIDKKDFATHDYRRCYARRVWTKFKDLQVLQDLLNHSNPSTTMLYLRHSGLKMVDYQKEMQK